MFDTQLYDCIVCEGSHAHHDVERIVIPGMDGEFFVCAGCSTLNQETLEVPAYMVASNSEGDSAQKTFTQRICKFFASVLTRHGY